MNIILQIVIGYILADLAAGIFHWFEDSYLDYCIDIPVISDIAKDNEMHHYFPRSIVSYTYLENMYVTFPSTIILLLILYSVNKSLFKYVYLIGSFAFFSITSNLIHRFAHMRECENYKVITFLQNTGILSSHKNHSIHHLESKSNYCVISDYNNYILDTIQFWRGLEYIIFIVTGIQPNKKLGYNQYREIQNHMHENAKLECPVKPTKEDIIELQGILKRYKNCDC